MGEAEGACAVLLEALVIFSYMEDGSYRASRDYDGLSADLVAAIRLVHPRHNKPKSVRLVWSKPLNATPG